MYEKITIITLSKVRWGLDGEGRGGVGLKSLNSFSSRPVVWG